MLLLIAVANTHYWFEQNPNASQSTEARISGLLHLLVDGRAYPLFALLLGYGLARSAHRSIHTDLTAGLDRTQAQRRAIAVLRTRGLWLLAIGVVHALFFAQDIIGVYGLVTLMLASTIVACRWRAALLLTLLICALSTSFAIAVGPEAVLARNHGMAAQALFNEQAAGLAFNLAIWMVQTPATALLSMVVPSTLLGAWLADRGLIERPHQHRRELTSVVLVGLMVPTTFAPILWMSMEGTGGLARVLTAWHQGVGALVTAAAYLALIALATSSRASGCTVGLTHALMATGQNSLSAYLAQTVALAITAGALRFCGVQALSSAWQLVVAGAVWMGLVLVCSLMHRRGGRGSTERLLRQLTRVGHSNRGFRPR